MNPLNLAHHREFSDVGAGLAVRALLATGEPQFLWGVRPGRAPELLGYFYFEDETPQWWRAPGCELGIGVSP